eukprot:TRINITY_DN37634_c0_g1_i2.p1 TRINITY_DN37634_c0_g1~~TRINITY_DN37634_c0_g1_i2.p1  ORF type:complete len:1083 (+),score=153.96 TRINITY_DN37634_c0_g1_i2:197-3445(+)
MQELQEAIIRSFQGGQNGHVYERDENSGNDTNSVQQQTVEYLRRRKGQSDIWIISLKLFEETQRVEVQFWCLQTLHELINTRFQEVGDDLKSELKSVSIRWLQNCAQSPKYIRNKVAQVVTALIKVEYPQGKWPDIFNQLLQMGISRREGAEALCRVMNAMDEDVISLEIPRSKEGSALSMQLKDALRETCIRDLIGILQEISSGKFGLEPAEMALGVLKKYIHWVDIELVANAPFIQLFYSLLNSKQENLVMGAAECMSEVVGKKMEVMQKVQLIQQLKIVEICAQWVQGFPIDADLGSEVCLSLSKLVSQLAAELMEILRYLENVAISFETVNMSDQVDMNTIKECSEMIEKYLDQLFPVILMVLRGSTEEVTNAMIQFLNVYIGRIRTMQKKAGANVSLPSMYPHDSCMYELSTNVQSELQAAEEEQEEVSKRRHNLFVVFKNIAQIVPEQAAAFVEWVIKQTIVNQSGNARFQDVELAVSLMYELGEGANQEFAKPNCGAFGNLAHLFYSLELIPCGRHRSVALPVLECYVRYVKFLEKSQDAAQVQAVLSKVLRPFLDERGIGHPSEDVSTRACYLLQRFIKQLRERLSGQVAEIVSALKPFLAHIATTQVSESSKLAMEKTSGVLDDRLYAFEAVSYLLGLESLAAEQQQALLMDILHPLVSQIQSGIDINQKGFAPTLGMLPASQLVHQALEAMSRSSKGFGKAVIDKRPQLKEIFKQCIIVALQVPPGFPGNRQLRSRVIAFLHRMVECLHQDVFPLLPQAINSLRTEIGGDVEGALLLQQMIVKFKGDLWPLVKEVLPDLLTSLLSCLPEEWDWSCQGVVMGSSPRGSSPKRGVLSADEEIREKAEIQKIIYSLLLTLAQHNMWTDLMQLDTQQQLAQKCLKGLVVGGAQHSEPSTRKACVVSLALLVKQWSGDANVGPKWAPFAIQQIGCEVCFQGLLTSESILDVRDATSLTVVSEACSLVKFLYSQYGDPYIMAVQSCLESCGLGPDLISTILSQIKFQDSSALKETLKGMLLHRLGVMLGSQRLCQMAERSSKNVVQQQLGGGQQQQVISSNSNNNPAAALYPNGIVGQ